MDDSDISLESMVEADSLGQLRIDAATRGSNTDSRAKTKFNHRGSARVFGQGGKQKNLESMELIR